MTAAVESNTDCHSYKMNIVHEHRPSQLFMAGLASHLMCMGCPDPPLMTDVEDKKDPACWISSFFPAGDRPLSQVFGSGLFPSFHICTVNQAEHGCLWGSQEDQLEPDVYMNAYVGIIRLLVEILLKRDLSW